MHRTGANLERALFPPSRHHAPRRVQPRGQAIAPPIVERLHATPGKRKMLEMEKSPFQPTGAYRFLSDPRIFRMAAGSCKPHGQRFRLGNTMTWRQRVALLGKYADPCANCYNLLSCLKTGQFHHKGTVMCNFQKWIGILLIVGNLGGLGTPRADDPPMHDAVKPVPKPDKWWQDRHQSFNKRAQAGNVNLLFVGDSITQGWENPDVQRNIWAKHFGPRQPMNAGIGGDRTQHVLWRLDNGNITGIKPKVVVLMIGTNNAGANTPEQIADGIKAVVGKLRAKLPETKVLLLAIFPRGANPSDVLRQKNTKANELAKTCADGKMVHYLDIGPKFLQEGGVLSKEIMPDLLHLSVKGYQIWADAIESKLAELLGDS